MDFSFTDIQEELRKVAREFMKRHFPSAKIREMEEDSNGFDADLWKQVTQMGWTGWIIPQKYGGLEGEFMDLVVILEEMGRACFLSPFFSTILCTFLLLEAGNEEQKKNILPSLVGGKSIATLALYEPDGGYTPAAINLSAIHQDNGFLLQGIKLFVPYAHIADLLLCVSRTHDGSTAEGITLFLVESMAAGISQKPLITLAGDRQSEVNFNKVKVTEVLGEINKGWLPLQRAIQKGNVLQCADMVGGMQKALEMTVDYAKQRVQFGRPIGSFQAIQHKCADMAVLVDGARYITYAAACKVRDGESFAPEVAMAKAYASNACRRVTKEAHQIFAGVGFMMEHDSNFYYRRAKALEMNLGDVDYQVMEVARGLGF